MAVNMYDEFVSPATLTGYARTALKDLAENQFVLSRWLPDQTINDLTFRFSKGTNGGLREAASYRAFDAEPDFGSREGLSRVSGELPPIARQMVLGEYDQLRLRNASQEIRDLLLRDAERITEAIATRFEFARADALLNASVTLDEPGTGLKAYVDFGRNPAHEVTAGVAWSDLDTSTPLDDLEQWTTVYNDSNGRMPGAFLTSRRVVRNLARNAQIQGELYPNNSDRRVSLADVNAYMGELGYPEFVIFDAQAIQNGVTKRFIPEDKLLMLPSSGTESNPRTGELGATLWGTTAEALEPAYGVEDGSEPGIVVGSFKQSETPVRVFTIGSAIGLPIVANPDLTFVSTVL